MSETETTATAAPGRGPHERSPRVRSASAGGSPVVWVVGSLNLDLVVRVDRHPMPGETVLGGAMAHGYGGKGANQAIAAASAGATVRLIGRVGNDSEGQSYLHRLRAFGVDVSRVRIDPDQPTGRAFVAVSRDGENTIIVSPGANGELSPDDISELAEAHSGDVFVVQGEIPSIVIDAAAALARRTGARMVLNLAPVAEISGETAAVADPLVINETEAIELRAMGIEAESLLVTRGAEGAEWGDVRVPAVSVRLVVDTTGAGDTFVGALAAALATGSDRATALQKAAQAAAGNIIQQGAQPRVPTDEAND